MKTSILQTQELGVTTDTTCDDGAEGLRAVRRLGFLPPRHHRNQGSEAEMATVVCWGSYPRESTSASDAGKASCNRRVVPSGARFGTFFLETFVQLEGPWVCAPFESRSLGRDPRDAGSSPARLPSARVGTTPLPARGAIFL